VPLGDEILFERGHQRGVQFYVEFVVNFRNFFSFSVQKIDVKAPRFYSTGPNRVEIRPYLPAVKLAAAAAAAAPSSSNPLTIHSFNCLNPSR